MPAAPSEGEERQECQSKRPPSPLPSATRSDRQFLNPHAARGYYVSERDQIGIHRTGALHHLADPRTLSGWLFRRTKRRPNSLRPERRGFFGLARLRRPSRRKVTRCARSFVGGGSVPEFGFASRSHSRAKSLFIARSFVNAPHLTKDSAESACKPDSVPLTLVRLDDHPSGAAIARGL